MRPMRQMAQNAESGGTKQPLVEAIEGIYQAATEPTQCSNEQEILSYGVQLSKQPCATGHYTRFHYVSIVPSSNAFVLPPGKHLAKVLDLTQLRPMALAIMLDYSIKILDYVAKRQMVAHVARVYHMFMVDNRLLCIVMQYYPNHSVHRWLAQRQPITLELIRTWSLQLGSVCSYMMDKGISHRSIRVEHLLLDKSNQIHLTGWSRAVFVVHPVTHQPELCNREPRQHKRNHMPPECFLLAQYNPTVVDHWSFATMIIAFFTSRHPFRPKDVTHRSYPLQWADFARRHGSLIEYSVLDVLNRAFHLTIEKRANATEILQASFFASPQPETNICSLVTDASPRAKRVPSLDIKSRGEVTLYPSVKSVISDKIQLKGNVIDLNSCPLKQSSTTNTRKSIMVAVQSSISARRKRRGSPPKCISPQSVLKLTGARPADIPTIHSPEAKMDAHHPGATEKSDAAKTLLKLSPKSTQEPKKDHEKVQSEQAGKDGIPSGGKSIIHLSTLLASKPPKAAIEQFIQMDSKSPSLKPKDGKKQMSGESKNKQSPPLKSATKELEAGSVLSKESVSPRSRSIQKDIKDGVDNEEAKNKDMMSWSSDYLTAPRIVSSYGNSVSLTHVPELKTYSKAVQNLLGSKSVTTSHSMVCVKIKTPPKEKEQEEKVVDTANVPKQDNSPSTVDDKGPDCKTTTDASKQ